MKYQKGNKIYQAYQRAQQMSPLFYRCSSSSLPLTYQDSLSPIPDHPFSTIGVLTAQGQWGIKEGVAFVVKDNYLLTCASNCYSHQHGEYPNITFKIKSNKQSKYDTHKVSKVFIPQQYKILAEDKRKSYNYALLYIEGEQSMVDRYGSIGVNFTLSIQRQTCFEQVVIKDGHLKLWKWETFLEEQSIILVGGPLLNKDSAVGIICEDETNSETYSLRFTEDTYSQFSQWVKISNGQFDLYRLSAYQMDSSCLKDMIKRPIQEVVIRECHFNKRYSFEELPFSHISQLRLINYKKSYFHLHDDVTFLKSSVFKHLKHLQIKEHKIGPYGCQNIASLSLNNLRQLDLSYNPIKDQGCRHISKADWPSLRVLFLSQCEITNNGVAFLCQSKRRNLSELHLRLNKLSNCVSKSFENANFPRIDYLNLGDNLITAMSLDFLTFPSWNRLKQLSLYRNSIASKGCKLFKEAGLALQSVSLSDCRIASAGIKWLCKANLTKIKRLSLDGNLLEQESCYSLSKVTMPILDDINLKDNPIRIKGMRRLLSAEWAQQATNNQYSSNFKQFVEQFERLQYDSQLQD